jgi:tetratricopeptide (TPR) repeat protein
MSLDILRAELERLFELDELKELSGTLLGLAPDDVGGEMAKGSFAKALVDRCATSDSIEALCDAVAAARSDVDPRISELRVSGFRPQEELEMGESLGGRLILRKLGEGRLGVTYLARHDGQDVRLKILRRDVTLDKRGLQRFLTATRMVAGIGHLSLPSDVWAGQVGDRWGVSQPHLEGETLAARLQRSGPIRLTEAREILQGILGALAALHERRMAHGDLRLENVLLVPSFAGEHVVLLDPGSDHLRAPAPIANGHGSRLAVLGGATLAPEQIAGKVADARSDVYAFGALLHQLLSGKPVFASDSPIEALVGHLTREPEPVSEAAPRGWVTSEIDNFVLGLLDKDPSHRPKDAAAVLESMELLGDHVSVPGASLSEEELEQRMTALVTNPWDEEEAAMLESAIDEGVDPGRVAYGFRWVAEQLNPSEGGASERAQKRMLFRAAKLYETSAQDPESAERIYTRLLEIDPSDDGAQAALERVRRRLGKFDELVEMLLARSEAALPGSERARALAEIGKVYNNDLNDKEQALVAYTQAFCEDPHESSYGDEVERLAGSRRDAWQEALASCIEASQSDLAADTKNLILARMGRWYADKVQRPDLALPCFQSVLSTDPANDQALEGMASIYRKAQQWAELGQVLVQRAEAAAPALARDLRAEAAEILEQRLGAFDAAREIYERVLSEDPTHEGATEALSRIYEASSNWTGLVKALERRAGALRGEARHQLLCRIAEVYEDRLDDVVEAGRRFHSVLEEDPQHLDALRGIDRVFNRTGRYKELVDNLHQQIKIAVTPRQRIGLWERVAAIYEEEFLDHNKAAEACESILDIDGNHDGALTSLERHYRALERWGDVVLVLERHIALITEPSRKVEKGLSLAKVLAEQLNLPERSITAYEAVLEVQPENTTALDALARLRASAGDAGRALEAIEALAIGAATPEAKAEQYLRAAKLLEDRGDLEGAIERYKRALDASPKDRKASAALRSALVRQGNAKAAVELLERELEDVEGEAVRGRLAGELAKLYNVHLHDDLRADAAARRALRHDPANIDALTALGDLAASAGHFLEAAKHYESVVGRTDALERDEALRVLRAFIDALTKSGSPERALAACDSLLRLAPDELEIAMHVGDVVFDHGTARQAFELYWKLVHEFREDMAHSDRAVVLYRLGESARRGGDHESAVGPLQESASLDHSSPLALRALAKIHEAEERWDEAIRTMYSTLERVSGDERVELLLGMGDIAATKLRDATYAAKNYLTALSESPNDRKILMKLMQLYSEEKDWRKLVRVVLKLSDFVDDNKQKAKYLHTAAMVAYKEMGDVERALEILDQALVADPDMQVALEEALNLRKGKGDYEGVKQLLKHKAKVLTEAGDLTNLIPCLHELAELYLRQFRRLDQAIAVLESAHEVDPDNEARQERLAELYSRDPTRYLDKAVAAQAGVLRYDPYRPETYKALRKLYTTAKRPDSSWCVCQALVVLNRAEPDEAMFYKRMRSGDVATPQDRFNDQDWFNLVMHADADPLLTGIFALIQRAVIAARAKRPEEYGYGAEHRLDPQQHPYMVVQSIGYMSDILGMAGPPLYHNANDNGFLTFLHAPTPSLVLGRLAIGVEELGQDVAFMTARHLTYFRPGMYVRHLIPTSAGLKAWLFAAIKLITPHFPVTPDLENPIREAVAALERGIVGPERDHLARIVGKLLQQGQSLDLKRWVAGVDLTADRVGLIFSDDLGTAIQLLRSSPEDSSSVPGTERVKELMRYSVSEEYFGIRARLRIAVDS